MTRFTLATLAVGLVGIISASGRLGADYIGQRGGGPSGDTSNAIVRGADPTGRVDSWSAFSGASSDAEAAGTAILAPSGAYRLNKNYEPPVGLPFFASAASFTPGMLGVIGDLTKYKTFTFYKVTDTPDTDNVVNVAMVARGSAASSNYQKSAIFARVRQDDPGSCVPGGGSGHGLVGCKDVVGITASGSVAPGIKNGRAYGANFTAELGPGATGVAQGYEVGVYNNTGTDKTADFYTGHGGGGKNSFGGSSVVCGGNAPCDAGYFISSLNTSQAKWAAGIRILRGAVRDYVLEVNDDTTGNLNNRPTWIKANGDALFSALTATGDASIAGKVGFNGAAPAEKCSLDAALPTNGKASNAALASALNKVRSCLVTLGLAR